MPPFRTQICSISASQSLLTPLTLNELKPSCRNPINTLSISQTTRLRTLEVLDFVEQFARGWDRVGVDVRPSNHAFAIDDEHRSFGFTGVFVEHVERFDHFAVGPEIASNRERHLTVLVAAILFHARSPRLLNRNRISTNLDDLSVESNELIVVCAEPAHLVQSATGEASRMKPDNHRFASKIGEFYLA